MLFVRPFAILHSSLAHSSQRYLRLNSLVHQHQVCPVRFACLTSIYAIGNALLATAMLVPDPNANILVLVVTYIRNIHYCSCSLILVCKHLTELEYVETTILIALRSNPVLHGAWKGSLDSNLFFEPWLLKNHQRLTMASPYNIFALQAINRSCTLFTALLVCNDILLTRCSTKSTFYGTYHRKIIWLVHCYTIWYFLS